MPNNVTCIPLSWLTKRAELEGLRSSKVWKSVGAINAARFPKALLNNGEELFNNKASRLRQRFIPIAPVPLQCA